MPEYTTDKPRLKKSSDEYYTGYGPTWGVDLDGKRYWKKYYRHALPPDHALKYSALRFGDIIDEKARIKKLVRETLKEILAEKD